MAIASDLNQTTSLLEKLKGTLAETEAQTERTGDAIERKLTGPFKMLDAAAQATEKTLKSFNATLGDTAKQADKAGGEIERKLTGPLRAVESAARVSGSSMKSFGSIVTGVIGKVSGLAALGGGAASWFGGNAAVKAASDYADLQAQLEAVTGSKSAMDRKLDFVQQVAGPSSYTFKQLASAASLLEAMNVNSERALPTMARLGMVFGADNEKLQVLVRGMGGLAQGKFFDSDVSASFGLNRAQFEQRGIQFDGNGQLLSSATKTMEALEAIVNTKYGTIFDKMKDVPSTKLASLTDAWERLERIVGDGIMKIAAPGMDRLAQTINALGDSGVALDAVSRTVEGIERMMGSIGLGGGDGMTKFLAGTLSVVSGLPDALRETGGYLKGVFDVVTNNVSSIFNRLTAEGLLFTTTITNGIFERLETLANGVLSSYGLSARLQLPRLDVPDLAAQYLAKVTPLKDMPEFPKLGLLDKYNEYYDKLSASMKPLDSAVPDARGSWLNRAMDNASGAENKLSQIVTNTGKTADLMSLRAQATGPGASGVIAPTAAELRGMNQPMPPPDYRGAENDFTRFVEKVSMNVYQKMQSSNRQTSRIP